MMSSLLAVMTGIEARLKTIPGLRTSATIPDTISPPHAMVGLPIVTDYHAQLGRPRATLEAQITLLTSAGWTRTGQEQLAAYADVDGDLSVIAAIEADRRLGGACGDCTVQQFRPLTGPEFGEIGYYGGLFTLLILP